MSNPVLDAFSNQNYHSAVELYERCIHEKSKQNQYIPHDIYYGYGESLARCGRLENALEVYTYIAYKLDGVIPWERLQHLAVCILCSYAAQTNNTHDECKTTNFDSIAAAAVLSSVSGTRTTQTTTTTTSSTFNATLPSSIRLGLRSSSSSTTTTAFSTVTTNNVASIRDKMLNFSKPATPLSKNYYNANNSNLLKRKRNRVFLNTSTSTPTSTVTSDHFDFKSYSIEAPIIKSNINKNSTLKSENNINYNIPLYNKNKSVIMSNNGNIYSNRYDKQNEHRTNHRRGMQLQKTSVNKFNTSGAVDPLLCSICEDILRCPVTTSCGHTFCRECCFAKNSNNEINECHLCQLQKPQVFKQLKSFQNIENNTDNGSSNTTILLPNLKPDVLVRRLVDKFWGPELQARKLNEQALHFMDIKSFDEALQLCNQSLEKCPKHINSLLLRSEVLYKLNHFKSSLADADSALKCNPSSAKAFFRRARALTNLGKADEAIIAYCVTAGIDLDFLYAAHPTFKIDLAKLLQCMITSVTKTNHSISKDRIKIQATISNGGQNLNAGFDRRHCRRKLRKIAENINDIASHNNKISIMSDCDENISSYDEDDVVTHNQILNYNSSKMEIKNNNSSRHRRHSKRFKNSDLDPELLKRNQSTAAFQKLFDRIEQELNKVNAADNNLEMLAVSPNQVDVADFDCVLCCRTLWKPVVTPCGHTYCWVCLDRCMDYSSSCPLCMSPLIEQCHSNYDRATTPLPFSLIEKSVTRFLEIAMQRFIPEWYEKRRRQELESEPSVPVFICTTAFPNVPCPLFVYEPRYRLMVRRAIESGERQFGIVQPNNGKSRYSDIGTMLDIKDSVLLGDGCSILSTIGCKRFKILTRNEKDGYETAKVEYINDEPISKNSLEYLTNKHNKVYGKATRWFKSLDNSLKEEILRSFGTMPDQEDNWETTSDGPAWAWWIIAILPLNQQLKVNILETTSLEKRLRAIEKTLDYITGEDRRLQQENCLEVPPTACDGLSVCQTVECCQQASVADNADLSETVVVVDESEHHHHHHHHHDHHNRHHNPTSYLL